MDGNGRLSRYLIHHCLGQSGRLPPQFLLPISVAMKKHEADYLQALTAFSQPARQLCQVTRAGDEHYTYDWAPEADTWFRYMDLTEAVTFTLAMAEASLDTHMRQEVEFLGLSTPRQAPHQRPPRPAGQRSGHADRDHLPNGVRTLSNNRRKRYRQGGACAGCGGKRGGQGHAGRTAGRCGAGGERAFATEPALAQQNLDACAVRDDGVARRCGRSPITPLNLEALREMSWAVGDGRRCNAFSTFGGLALAIYPGWDVVGQWLTSDSVPAWVQAIGSVVDHCSNWRCSVPSQSR
ncbi:MAG: hypothetical protein R3E56_16915 [Burkholderiaceae bacterium]